MAWVDENLLVQVGERQYSAPPFDGYMQHRDLPEVGAALKARNDALDVLRAFCSRVREIRLSRGLTDAEKVGLRLKAADDAAKKLVEARKLVEANGEKIEARQNALKPATGPLDDSKLAVDLQLLGRVEQWNEARRSQFLESLRGEQPLSSEIRLGEAVVRSQVIGTLPPAFWTATHDALFEHRNKQALNELRAVKGATQSSARWLEVVRDAVETEVAADRRHSSGMFVVS